MKPLKLLGIFLFLSMAAALAANSFRPLVGKFDSGGKTYVYLWGMADEKVSPIIIFESDHASRDVSVGMAGDEKGWASFYARVGDMSLRIDQPFVLFYRKEVGTVEIIADDWPTRMKPLSAQDDHARGRYLMMLMEKVKRSEPRRDE